MFRRSRVREGRWKDVRERDAKKIKMARRSIVRRLISVEGIPGALGIVA